MALHSALFRRAFAGVSCTIACASHARAADIRPVVKQGFVSVVIEGVIERGDADVLVQIIRNYRGKVSDVTLFSPGGDVMEAMRLGGLLRRFELSSQVPMQLNSKPWCSSSFAESPKTASNCTCASACFLVHVGAVHRGGTYLAVHRPTMAPGVLAGLPASTVAASYDAMQDSVRRYMVTMGVPVHIAESVLAIPPERILLLDETVVRTFFWLQLPAREEWQRQNCLGLPPSDEQRYQTLLDRIVNSSGTRTSALQEVEQDDYDRLRARRGASDACRIALTRTSRLQAYAGAFGSVPEDTAGYVFSRWHRADQYLGRAFFEIVAEEAFSLKEDLGTPSLSRDATYATPQIFLSGSMMQPRVVHSASLASDAHPSASFTAALIATLDAAWGRHIETTTNQEWRWSSHTCDAALQLMTGPAGPYLSLRIAKLGY